jgi:hypothetical protein
MHPGLRKLTPGANLDLGSGGATGVRRVTWWFLSFDLGRDQGRGRRLQITEQSLSRSSNMHNLSESGRLRGRNSTAYR